jgi:hypothetical protein
MLTPAQIKLAADLVAILNHASGAADVATTAPDNDVEATMPGKAPKPAAKGLSRGAKAVADPVPVEPPAKKTREQELQAMAKPALEKIAISFDYPEDGVKKETKAALVKAILDAEAEDAAGAEVEDDDEEEVEDADDEAEDDDDEDTEDDEDESDEDEDDAAEDEDEEAELSRDELRAMGLRPLRAYVKANYDWNADELEVELSKADIDTILDYIAPEGEDEGEDEEDEESDDALTEEDLDAMSLSELKDAVKQYGGKVPARATPAALKKIVMDLAEVPY